MWASEKQREECPLSDLWISVKCGESDTTSGLAANPTVGNLMDKLEPLGVHLCFGETSELTGAEQVCAKRGATPEASGVAPLLAQTCSAPVNSEVSPKHKWTPKGSNLSIKFPTVGLAASPEVVSDSPHLTEIHKSLKGHSSLCFSDAHIENS